MSGAGFSTPSPERGQHVGAEIDGQDLDDRERQRNTENDKREIRDQLRHVRGENVGEEIADIGEDGAAFLDRGDDAREVVVEQHHVGSFASHVSAAAAHGDADVGFPQGRCVVHAVARHGDDCALLFQRADDAHFLFREYASKDDLRGVER